MRFQTSKNSTNFACECGGFLQTQLYLPYRTKLWQIATQIGRSVTLDRRIKTVGGQPWHMGHKPPIYQKIFITKVCPTVT